MKWYSLIDHCGSLNIFPNAPFWGTLFWLFLSRLFHLYRDKFSKLDKLSCNISGHNFALGLNIQIPRISQLINWLSFWTKDLYRWFCFCFCLSFNLFIYQRQENQLWANTLSLVHSKSRCYCQLNHNHSTEVNSLNFWHPNLRKSFNWFNFVMLEDYSPKMRKQNVGNFLQQFRISTLFFL